MCNMKLAAFFHLVLINGFFYTIFASESQAPLDNQQESLKRASSGFMPMRGRKDGRDESYNGDFLQEKRGTSAFMPMRGKKGLSDIWMMENEKRAAFMPMRGRRMDSGPEYGYVEQEPRLVEYFADGDKRGSSGFMPMRGKKLSDDIYQLEPKRKFHALRGKKWPDANDDVYKRGNAFFGMRG